MLQVISKLLFTSHDTTAFIYSVSFPHAFITIVYLLKEMIMVSISVTADSIFCTKFCSFFHSVCSWDKDVKRSCPPYPLITRGTPNDKIIKHFDNNIVTATHFEETQLEITLLCNFVWKKYSLTRIFWLQKSGSKKKPLFVQSKIVTDLHALVKEWNTIWADL